MISKRITEYPDYYALYNQLVLLLNNHGFNTLLSKNNKDTDKDTTAFIRISDLLNVDSDITIHYPGKKATSTRYDFRVDLQDMAQSYDIKIKHADIADDLYYKSKYFPNIIPQLYQLLSDIAIHANFFDYYRYQYIDDLKITENTHLSNLKIKRLVILITLILLQEDINYPNGQGRCLALARYIEAIAINDNTIQTRYSIQDVKTRIDQTYPRPALFSGLPYIKVPI